MRTKHFMLAIGLALVPLLMVLGALTPMEARAVAAPTAEFPILYDFESGIPEPPWFSYSNPDNVATFTFELPTVADSDMDAIPGQVGDNTVFSATVDTPSWGGLGSAVDPVQNWSDYDAVSLWFYGSDSGITYTLEIQTVPGDDRRATFVDDFTGWQQIILPFSTFGAGGEYDVSQVDNWVFVLDGISQSFRIDDLQIVNLDNFADFENGLPEPPYFSYSNPDNVATFTFELPTVADSDMDAIPGQVGDNTVFSATVDTPSWGGFGSALDPVQNWSDYDGVSLWFYGSDSGITYTFEIQTAPGDDRRATFVDDFTGWQQVVLPFSTFGAGGAYDVSQVDNWVFVLDGISASFRMDNLAVYGDAAAPTVRVGFESGSYTVEEGSSATISVTLNVTSTDTITVSYATADGTAEAGADYTAISGDLVFTPGLQTQTLTVDTIDNDVSNENKTVALTLSGPVNAELDTIGEATLTIVDDEEIDICSTRSDTVDDFENGLAVGTDGDGNSIGFFTFQDTNASTTVTFTTSLVDDTDPLALPGQSGDNNIYQVDVNVASFAGTTHAFENIPVDTWTPQDWSSYAGISFWFYGQNTGTVLGFEIQDNRQPGSTGTDTEIWNYTFNDDFEGWKKFELRFSDFSRKEIGNGAPNDGFGLEQVHAWAFLSLSTGGADVTYYMDDVIVCGIAEDKPLSVAFDQGKYTVDEGDTAVLTVELSKPYTDTVTVDYATGEASAQEDEQYMPVSGTLTFPAGTITQTISITTTADEKYTRDTRVTVNLYQNDVELGFQRRAVVTITDLDMADPTLVDDFEGYHPYINQTGAVTLSVDTLTSDSAMARPGQAPYEDVLTVEYDGEAEFSRAFSQGQDWSAYDGVQVWVYGENSGNDITYVLHDNMISTTAEVDSEDWVMVWSDEFNDPAGTPPNPNVWKYEIGDGALNDIVGWGNSESQYYTDSLENSFTDGAGNLVIRMQEVNTTTTDLVCWYGTCEYTSARLITQDRIDFEYGRIEARVQVPDGPSGLWPAFWMLGTDIPEVGWPQTGEIDIMEYISREPFEVFGTIHGPGYAGGASYGETKTFTQTIPSLGYVTYTVDWSPDLIIWYVNGEEYHRATPDDDFLDGKEWVFNHPFFLLLNVAIGGNFGGAIDPGMTMPQDTVVDYVRVYQAADTAERFEATITDDFTGWQQVFIPFEDFTRSADQPAGAPDDGLGLTEVWGYGFQVNGSGTLHMDQVRVSNLYKLYAPIIVK